MSLHPNKVAYNDWKNGRVTIGAWSILLLLFAVFIKFNTYER